MVAAGAEVSAAMAELNLGNLDQATSLAEHACSLLRQQQDDDRSAGKALMVLAWVARERKDWRGADRHARDAIAQMSRLHPGGCREAARAAKPPGQRLARPRVGLPIAARYARPRGEIS